MVRLQSFAFFASFALFLPLGLSACGGQKSATVSGVQKPAAAHFIRTQAGKPPIAVVERQGDPAAAISAAVLTSHVDDAPADVAIALGSIMEARLVLQGFDASARAGWDGYRIRILVADPAEAGRAIAALQDAMLLPITSGREMELANQRVEALARRHLPDHALLPYARCTGESWGMKAQAERVDDRLEGWRKAAHTNGRVAFGVAGGSAIADAVERGLASRGEWPPLSRPLDVTPIGDGKARIYDATGTLVPNAARINIAVSTPTAAEAVLAAAKLGEARGSLSSRLLALDSPGVLRSVTASAEPGGGCLAVSIDLSPREMMTEASNRIATATALAEQELLVQIGTAPRANEQSSFAATAGTDPRDAAERAAWWTITTGTAATNTAAGKSPLQSTAIIGIASSRDAAPDAFRQRAEAIRSDLDRATVLWHSPVVEARSRVETGQGELWILFASTCGTLAEVDSDSGAAAAFALAASKQANAGHDVAVEPWIAADGIGVFAHAPREAGETAAAHARRVADAAARSFVADPIEPSMLTRARGELLSFASESGARQFGTVASILAPGHSSWVEPRGNYNSLSQITDTGVLLRGTALRSGPLRAAILANDNGGQAEAAQRAIDRWVARRPGETRACPSAANFPAPRPGTYVADALSPEGAEAWLALPLPSEEALQHGKLLAAALNGPMGLLAKSLAQGLAREYEARIVGLPRAGAIVIHLSTSNDLLDGAVAQTRALLVRLRQGALTAQDHERARLETEKANLRNSLDPRARLLALFRGSAATSMPTSEEWSAFCRERLRDDALVIVAARPPRIPAVRDLKAEKKP